MCKLRNINICQDDGRLVDYPDLNTKQTQHVLQTILDIVNRLDICEYLEMNAHSGRTMYKPFPDCIVYQIIDTHRYDLEELMRTNNVYDTPSQSQ